MSDFSTILKELRVKRRIKQTDIAKHLNVLPRTIRFYESGDRRPDFDGLISLAELFNVSLDYLVGRSDDDSSFITSPNYQTISAKMPNNLETKK